MNDVIVAQLKILVERAVRPVHASIAHKRKMREELLAHLRDVYETEAKLGDEAAALERTARRFGNPAELARQMQSAVSTRDRLAGLCEALVGLPPVQSAPRLALRHAAMVLAITIPALAIMVATRVATTGDSGEWLTIKRLPAITFPIYLALLMFCASLLGQGMAKAIGGREKHRWPRILAIGAAAWLLVPAWAFVFCFALTGALAATLNDLLPLLPLALLAPLVLVLAARACIPELRYCEEWASLKID